MVSLDGRNAFASCSLVLFFLFAQCDIICSWSGERMEDWVLDLGASSLPSQPRVNLSRAAPQLVIGWNCTSPHGERYICIFVPEADGLNVLIAGFRSELKFFQMITVCFHHTWCLPVWSAAIRDVGRKFWRRIWATTPVAYASKKRR